MLCFVHTEIADYDILCGVDHLMRQTWLHIDYNPVDFGQSLSDLYFQKKRRGIYKSISGCI